MTIVKHRIFIMIIYEGIKIEMQPSICRFFPYSDCTIIDMKHVIITFIKVLIFSLCFGKDTLSRLSCAKYVNNSWNERSIATEKIVKYCTLSRLHIENKIRSLLFFNESYFYNSMSVFVCFCV